MIDFSDPSSYRGINSDDLAIYVKLEQTHLNREIENVLGEGGTFSTHSTDEFARLQGDFNSAYESYVKGMALLSMGWYRTPMVPGGPDPMTFTKVVGSIALSCTLGPWAAFALNAALTGVDVADGTTAWKHAAVQLGVGAAAAYAPGIGSQLVNIAASGIDYEEGGGIGWDNKNFKQGVVRGVATMVITPALGGAMGEFGKTALGTGLSTGLTTFATNSLTAGDGWSIGWDGGNWQQHLTEGVASGVTAAVMQGARGKQGKDAQGRPITGTDKQPQPNVFGDSFVNKAVSGAINSSIMTMGYHAFGGNGFENNSFSKFNWNSMAYSAQDLGGFLGNKANEWILSRQEVDPVTKQKKSSGVVEDWVAKALQLSNQGDKYAKDFFHSIGAGLVSMASDAISGLYTPKIVREMNSRIQRDSKTNEITKESIAKIVKDLRKDDCFNDGLQNNQDLSENEKRLLKTVSNELNTVEEYNKRIGENGEKSLTHEEIIEYVNKKARLSNALGLTDKLTPGDMELLQKTLRQSVSRSSAGGLDSNGPLVKSLVNMIKQKTDVFDGLHEGNRRDTRFKNIYTKNTETLNVTDDQSILRFAQHIASNACLLISTYGAMIASGASGVPSSFGEFYYKAYTSNNGINRGYIVDHINRRGSDQNLVDKIMGGGNVFEVIRVNGSGARLLQNLNNQYNGSVTYGQVGVQYENEITGKPYTHYMMTYSMNRDQVMLNDMGRPKNDTPRQTVNIMDYNDYVYSDNIRSAIVIRLRSGYRFYSNQRRTGRTR